LAVDNKTGVILIGHGATAADTPRDIVAELKQLEGRRVAEKGAASPMSPREAELDKKVREWPRTPESDPYKSGLEDLAAKLRMFMASAIVEPAFNEFCAPSVEQAAEKLVKAGCRKVVLATVMTTRGGLHSEIEIPQICEALQKTHKGVEFVYAWPYDPVQVGELIARNLRNFGVN
jgi:sirohydrochlorin cobaltochelatase